MKITFEKKDLLKGLKIGGSLAGKNKVLPILDCVKVKIKGMTASFVSSDNENAISKKMPILESEGDCQFCVPLASFMSYVKLIAGDKVDIIYSDNTIEVKHEKGSIEFPVQSADEFPVISPDKDGEEIIVDPAYVYNFITEGQKFTANDDLRPIMGGVYIYQEDSIIGCCASDGNSLFTDEGNSSYSYNYKFVIGKNAFKTICEAIYDKNDEIKMRVGSTNVMFITEDCSIVSRLQEGRYPNFRSVIPKNNDIEIKLNCKELINAVNRCSIAANRSTNLVKLYIDGFTLEISCEDIDFNTKSKETIIIDGTQKARIGFNYGKLMNILTSIITDNVVISIKNESSAAIFRNDSENDKRIYLLMPMMLND